MMSRTTRCTPRKRTLLAFLIGAIGAPHAALAQQLPLVQYPAGSANRAPAPNVIVTLDDSGSMGYYTNANGGVSVNEADSRSGMYALKQALKDTFSATAQNIPDGAIRLAWNTLNNCRSIPSASGGCGSRNDMRVLDATHRARFLQWVGEPGGGTDCSRRLCASGSTPTHHAFIAAGDYLKNASATNEKGPWASTPYTRLAPVLSCRRSYNVLMTDGGWNFVPDDGTDVARGPGNGNADGTRQTLPDGKVYEPTSAQTRLYADGFGGNGTYDYYDNRWRRWTGNLSTLADLAFYYWATDLSADLANDLTPSTKLSGTQTLGTGNQAVELEQYWNPRNNPATWQHMSTYTIGFRDAAEWRTDAGYASYPAWDKVTNDTYAGSLADLASASNGKQWPDPIKGQLSLDETANVRDNNGESRKVELWHMALNGRGKFIPTTSSADLVKAFKDIFGEIVADNKAPITSYSNSASSIARADAARYTSGYEALGWKGYVRADTLAQSTGDATPATAWGTRNVAPPALPHLTTADKLDALGAADIARRLILTWSDAADEVGGASFQWAAEASPKVRAVTAAQKTLLKVEGTGAVNDTVGEQRLNFIRGDRGLEGNTFRTRVSRQGDIVNSQLWYVAQPVSNYSFDKYLAFAKAQAKRLPMVYAGGNDGMLHGFSGVDGSEKIAYVPKGVVQNLHELTRSTYQHRYYVDGSPFSGDVNWGDSANPNWRTLLVGTLGAGGKGYFVLDVTNPGSTATDSTAIASDMLKANADKLVVMDRTAAAGATSTVSDEADIGHLMVEPVLEDGNPQKTTQIVRMNDGRWALVMGNGVNSTHERPVLLVQYLDKTGGLLTIPAATTGANAQGNGLSAPRLVDINGDGTPDVVYAGDLRGNLWKFDLTSATPSEWAVAFRGVPLYTAAHVSGNVSTPQPITAPPLVRANDRGAGGLMVAFGTGRNLTEGDRSGTAVQSIYSVLDNTRYKLVGGKVKIDDAKVTPEVVGSGTSQLVQQTVDTTDISGDGSSSARKFWKVSQTDVAYDGKAPKKGWYLNLPVSGERLLSQMSFFDESNIIELVTQVPGSGSNSVDESCAPPPTAQQNYRTFLNIMDGKRPSVQIVNQNGDGAYSLVGDQGVSRMTSARAESRVSAKDKEIRIGSDGVTDTFAKMPEIPLRPNWRQLQ